LNYSEQLNAGNDRVRNIILKNHLILNLFNNCFLFQLESLSEAHPWIEEEKRNFGREGGVYDFKNIKEIQHRMHNMKSRKEKLEKQVDKRAQGQLAKKEEEVLL
jgi:hypothetical protein